MGNSKRVFEDIVQKIKNSITSGEFKINQKLGSERSLSHHFMVGRSSIREAIKTLEAIGLVVIKNGRNGGIFVSSGATSKTREALSYLLELESSKLMQSLEFRKIIEPKMAFYAASRRTKNDLAHMLKTIEDMKTKGRRGDNFARANRKFHLAVARASNNSFILLFYKNIFHMLEEIDMLVKNLPSQIDQTIYGHMQIYKAILEKNPQKASILMEVHLSQIEDDIRVAKSLGIETGRTN